MRRPTLPVCLVLAGTAAAAPPAIQAGDPADPGARGGLATGAVQTSVTGEPEPVHVAPGAVHVLTAEDIRRSGAANLPDLLRMVPGLHVAQIQSSAWSVSARGFGGEPSDKLLVLIDGRSVYSPLFAGVFWDAQDVVLEDVLRVEVLRGPSAARFGPGAVNGVVRVVTRSAAETHGLLLGTTVGTDERFTAVARYGAELGGGRHYRVYAKGIDRDAMDPLGAGAAFEDDQRLGQAGFRLDESAASSSFTLQGRGYYGRVRAPLTRPGTVVDTTVTEQDRRYVRGASLLGRWTERLHGGSSLAVQLYYDGTVRDSIAYEEGRDTLDADVSWRFDWTERQALTLGLGYRLTNSLVDDGRTVVFDPDERTDNLISAYVEDAIAIVPGRLDAVLGTRVEHNDYTAFELQPVSRLRWTPSRAHTVWAAVSRAVRTPSQADELGRIEEAFQTVGGQPTHVVLAGNRDVISEELWGYELGHRVRVSERVSLDTTAFVHDYDELRTREPGAPVPDPANPGQFVQDVAVDNRSKAFAWGVEVASQWNATDAWTLHGGYAFLDVDFELEAGSNDPLVAPPDRRSPKNLAHLRSLWDVTETVELDTALYWVDELDVGVPSYLRADVRIGWCPTDELELSAGVRGLVHDGEPELDAGFFGDRSETRTAAYLRLTWTPRPPPRPADLVMR